MTTEQISSIIVAFELGKEYFVWQMENGADMDQEERLEQFYESIIVPEHSDEDHEKVFALMEHTGKDWDYTESNTNYVVFTDEEADEEFDQSLENYIDDCVLCNIDQAYHSYFDRDAWIADNDDDRGSWLAYADGHENEETINGTTYFIYKR